MSIVTRFAPSPTGYLHIGGARTALFNWAFARANGGEFQLRIEDTDRERYTPEAVDAIMQGLKWLGIDHDGKVLHQFSRQERHAEVAKELLEKGAAYKCYCTPEELAEMREKGHGYDRRWRESDATAPEGIDPVIRIKAPMEGKLTIIDAVQGEVTIDAAQLDDFIILRSDGTPTYMLAVVVDDHDMGVTHVIRGDDHLNNAFRQRVIIEAMGWDVPVYAHIPLIHGEDGAKLSKRHGAVSVTDYDDKGYLPEAMVNYLMRLGWSHGDDEIFSREQMLEWFTLDGINKAPARLDFKKLDDVNAHYMHQADDKFLTDLIIERYGQYVSDDQRLWLLNGMGELKLRSSTLIDLEHDARIYIAPIEYEEKPMTIIADSKDTLQDILDVLENLEPFDADTIETEIKKLVNDKYDGKYGKVGMPFRAALTGRGNSPAVPGIAQALGREQTLERLKLAIAL